MCYKKNSADCNDCLNTALENIPTQAPIFSWLNDGLEGNNSDDEVRIMTNDPQLYDFVQVKEHENLADVARRVYGSNNVINRSRIDLANNGNIFGWIRIPK
jgi:hypothetical protein